MLGCSIDRIHILGGGSQNRLLSRLTGERSGKPVERGNAEGSTVGNFAVQLASDEVQAAPLSRDAVHRWAQRLSEHSPVAQLV
jgi:rhamnulokinase